MDLEIVEADEQCLAEYASVPSTVRVAERLVRPSSTSGAPGPLTAAAIAAPYDKDYDAQPALAPAAWPAHFDVSRWGLLIARRDNRAVGAAAVAPASAVMPLSVWTEPTAVLWDLRVAAGHRRVRIGEALFRAAERWALRHGFRDIVVETQDVNVAAARFYESMGCVLLSVEPDAYADVPGESRLIYRRRLDAQRVR